MPRINRREFLGAALIAASGRAAGFEPGVLVDGSATPAPAPILLRAGPVTALFEPSTALLRYVRCGGREILRGVYAAVRDRAWGTVTPRVSNMVLESRGGGFRLAFDVDCIEGPIDFGWKGVITGDNQGAVRFEFHGRARSTFLRNRLGFAVLHPIRECAGHPCTVETSAGRGDGRFPDLISPHQPFKDLRAISHTVAPGVTAEVRFEGDIFEMEDHRNWTDGNYKTYCTPLERPYPVEVPRGHEIRQAVSLRLQGAQAAPSYAAPLEVAIEFPNLTPVPIPAIGLGMASDAPDLTRVEIARLRAARPAHLRADLRLWDAGWRAVWDTAVRDSLAVGAGIEAAVHVSGNAERELAQLKEALAATPRPRISRWLVFHREERSTSEKWITVARASLQGAPVGAGTNEYFTELNRERPAPGVIDLACYSINPQVHAFDNTSLVENLEAQADTVRTAHSFLSGKPVAVTPITLRPRSMAPAAAGRLPARIDPRQMSLFGAAWTLGSIKYLAESKAASLTYYETHGWAGLMEIAAGSREPALFPSLAGAVFPLYHVLADVNEFDGGSVHPCVTADPLRVCALALSLGRRKRLLVANLTPRLEQAALDASWLGPRVRILRLDQHSGEQACRNPEAFRKSSGALWEADGGKYRLALLPYSVARLDA